MAGWVERTRAVSLSKATMNRLVMDYLVIEGHKEAAQAFERESRTGAGMDLDTISNRRLIRSCVEAGDISGAMKRADELIPGLLAGNEDLSFHIHRQQLVELIRADDVEQALQFAQEVLAPKVESSPALLQELERTMLLLAYADTAACPEADLLSQAQRQHTASLLNAAVLSAQAQQTEAALPMMLRRLHWAQDELQHRHEMSFARIDDYEEAIPHAIDASAKCSTTAPREELPEA